MEGTHTGANRRRLLKGRHLFQQAAPHDAAAASAGQRMAGGGNASSAAVLLPQLSQLEWLEYFEVMDTCLLLRGGGIPLEWGASGAFPHLKQ